MSDQHLIDTVLQYFRGSNNGDVELMMSTFTEDVAAYFIDMPPIRGSRNLAQRIKMAHDGMNARWTLDHSVVAGQEVVIEWSQLLIPSGTNKERFNRGVDWIFFKDGRIAELHQYYRPRDLGPDQIYELQGFPYQDRNYTSRVDFDSHLP